MPGRRGARRTALAVCAAVPFVMAAHPVLAGEREPVCRVATVVQEMARQLRARDHYASLDPDLVLETPTGLPNLVRCQVCVKLAFYDNPRFGPSSVRRCVAHGFEVRALHAGFVVRDLLP